MEWPPSAQEARPAGQNLATDQRAASLNLRCQAPNRLNPHQTTTSACPKCPIQSDMLNTYRS